jgi:transcriptional regulator with XRE-family HTH domain
MDDDSDPLMAEILARFEKSNLSLEELGRKMGYPQGSARKSAWQFMHKTKDPRLSMLRRFAQAAGISLRGLL